MYRLKFTNVILSWNTFSNVSFNLPCSPGVKICGHTVPHPAENRVHVNIQTTGENVIEVLKRGLQDLEKMCDHTLETFDKAYEKYKASQDVPDAT